MSRALRRREVVVPVAVLAATLVLTGGVVALRAGGDEGPTRPTATAAADAALLQAAARATLAHRSLTVSSPADGLAGVTLSGVIDTSTGNSRLDVRVDPSVFGGGAAEEIPPAEAPTQHLLVGNRAYLQTPATNFDGFDADQPADQPDGPTAPPKPWTALSLTPDELLAVSPVALLRAVAASDPRFPITSALPTDGAVRYRLAVPHLTEFDPAAVVLDVRSGEVVRVAGEEGEVPDAVPTDCPDTPWLKTEPGAGTHRTEDSEPDAMLLRGSDVAVTVVAPPAEDVEPGEDTAGDTDDEGAASPEPWKCDDIPAPPLPGGLPSDFPTATPGGQGFYGPLPSATPRPSRHATTG